MTHSTYFSADAVLALLNSDSASHSNGPSVLRKLVECARRVRLDSEAGTGDPLAPAREKMNVGTLVHKLTELHDSDLDPGRYMAKVVGHNQIDPLLDAAWTLYEKYAVEFPAGWWGVLLGAELKLSNTGSLGLETGTLDRIWAIDAMAQNRIETRFGIRLYGPGIYGWDLKTSGQKDNNLKEHYLYDPQPHRYLKLMSLDPGAWALPEGVPDELKGFIIFQAIRYKTDRQDRFQAACLDSRDVLGEMNTERQLAWQKQALVARAADEARPSACYSFGQFCPHFEAGRCPGF